MDEVYADLLRYETELEEKNTALEEAQAFISSVIESVSDILIVCDRNGVVLQINPGGDAAARHAAARPLAQRRSAIWSIRRIARGSRRCSRAQSPSDVIKLEVRFVTAQRPVRSVRGQRRDALRSGRRAASARC